MRPLVYESIFVSRVLIVQQSVLFRRHDRIPERNRVSRVPFRLVFGVDGDEDLFSVPREERSQVESTLVLSSCARRSGTLDGVFRSISRAKTRPVPRRAKRP